MHVCMLRMYVHGGERGGGGARGDASLERLHAYVHAYMCTCMHMCMHACMCMQVREEMHATFHQACRFEWLFWTSAYVLEQCPELRSADLPQSVVLRSADLPRTGMPSALVHVTRHRERE